LEKRLAIFGCGGFGREVLQLVRDINEKKATWTCCGFIVDPDYATESSVQGLPVLGGIEWLTSNPDRSVVVAIGSSAARHKITNKIALNCANSFASLVHPGAWVGSHVDIGAGSLICAGAVITTDIRIGKHVLVNISATIGHDAILKEFVTLNPGVNVSGNVTLSEGAEVGTGAVIIPKCVVGKWSIIGAGSVVTKDIKDNCTAVGSPARMIKERHSGWQNQ